MPSLEQRIVEGYTARGLTLAFAETDTGGLAGARITSVPGSSKVFPGAIVAYSNRIKTGVLGVDAEVLRANGAVSEPAARAMAEAARATLGTSVAVAATGIAGPTGGSAEKPVGTVYLAVATETGTRVERRQCTGERNEVRAAFAEAMLALATGVLDAG